ncbi:cistern family PEP-CTERM protein [Alteriqipengyuania flavescens]|uniref:cistern family PEP-CTERM protein n=1 Tax=Alteriqipengyuania flavescens TaxID=3053610 RepID=UPI0025B2D6B7|nr:cistern family PEP-CTERM protein [Alteriqipengyuania flavescens]WJY18304.1 cistern family PEP-CTERM protein [Alteriqipengyuania flavescens]WJY24245.1 cistern family PEP-CTERM protein [Alteriqipengyuania flavescens]
MIRLLSTAAALSLIVATPALATPITLDESNVGESFTLSYGGFSDDRTIDGLGAEATFTLTGVTDHSFTFDYAVTNTTASGLTSRISSFAFNTDPDIARASSTGAFNYTLTDSKYPNGIGNVDVCFKAARTNSCAGNRGGVSEGNTGTGSLTLNFADIVDTISLSDFFVRYQSITGAGHVSSANGAGTPTSTSTSTTSGTTVPEPGMLGLFGAGLLGLGLMRRRRKPAVA